MPRAEARHSFVLALCRQNLFSGSIFFVPAELFHAHDLAERVFGAMKVVLCKKAKRCLWNLNPAFHLVSVWMRLWTGTKTKTSSPSRTRGPRLWSASSSLSTRSRARDTSPQSSPPATSEVLTSAGSGWQVGRVKN